MADTANATGGEQPEPITVDMTVPMTLNLGGNVKDRKLPQVTASVSLAGGDVTVTRVVDGEPVTDTFTVPAFPVARIVDALRFGIERKVQNAQIRVKPDEAVRGWQHTEPERVQAAVESAWAWAERAPAVRATGESAHVRALRRLFKGGQDAKVKALREAFDRLPEDAQARVAAVEAEIKAEDAATVGEFDLS